MKSITELRPKERLRLAKDIIENPLHEFVLQQIETKAVNQAITAALTDNETRTAACFLARAARSLRTEYQTILAELSGIDEEELTSP